MGTKMGRKGKGKGKTKDKGRGKAGKTKSARTPAERGWQPADAVEWAQRAPLTAFASIAATSALIYVGGQVARAR